MSTHQNAYFLLSGVESIGWQEKDKILLEIILSKVIIRVSKLGTFCHLIFGISQPSTKRDIHF